MKCTPKVSWTKNKEDHGCEEDGRRLTDEDNKIDDSAFEVGLSYKPMKIIKQSLTFLNLLVTYKEFRRPGTANMTILGPSK